MWLLRPTPADRNTDATSMRHPAMQDPARRRVLAFRISKTLPQHDRGVMTAGEITPNLEQPEDFLMNDFNHANAFVVQFRTPTDFARGRVEGRVEHVASGRTVQFTSTRELLETFARLSKSAPVDGATHSTGD